MRRHLRHPRRSAFTLVELVIGMLVTTIVLGALAVFTFAVSENWMQSDSLQSAYLRETMAVERLSHIFREAQLTESSPTAGSMDNSTPPAACTLWTDSNGDGIIQYGELAMLQYVPGTQQLVEWTIPPTAINANSTAASILSESVFLALPNVVSTPVADNVLACELFCVNAGSQTQRPSIEVILQIQGSNPSVQSQVVYTTVALRAPNPNPQ